MQSVNTSMGTYEYILEDHLGDPVKEGIHVGQLKDGKPRPYIEMPEFEYGGYAEPYSPYLPIESRVVKYIFQGKRSVFGRWVYVYKRVRE